MLIKVDEFIYLVDFVVLENEKVVNKASQAPVILGHPFLAIANATVNYRSGVMDVSVMNMMVKLNIFKTSSQPMLEDE